jgi:hypothetical protein
MRIYKRAEFLKLPAGVMYFKGKPRYFEQLSVKGETGTNDWLERDYAGVEADDSEQWASRLDEMLETGVSYPVGTDFGRDGCFDDEEVFMVLEPKDLDVTEADIKRARAALEEIGK